MSVLMVPYIQLNVFTEIKVSVFQIFTDFLTEKCLINHLMKVRQVSSVSELNLFLNFRIQSFLIYYIVVYNH